MMLLGLVLHTAMNYITFPTGDVWPYKDAQTSPAFDILVAFIHTFRMPTFFVIAGFFAAFQYDTRGARGLFHNRLKRVGLPLVCGWFILFPMVIASAIFAQMRTSMPFEAKPEDMTLSALFNHLMHLWFLYDLLKTIVQKVVIECKLLHKSLEQTLTQGLEQTWAYMDRCAAEEGHLVVFDRTPGKSWEEKVFQREESVRGTSISVWGM